MSAVTPIQTIGATANELVSVCILFATLTHLVEAETIKDIGVFVNRWVTIDCISSDFDIGAFWNNSSIIQTDILESLPSTVGYISCQYGYKSTRESEGGKS